MIIRTSRQPTWAISRRSLLRGAGGIAMGLPFLNVMRPCYAQSGDAPDRVVYYYTPQGVIDSDWFPQGNETSFSLGEPMSPLENYKDNLLIFKGLSNSASNIEDGGAHFRGTASFLTCSPIEQDHISNGISADQHIANHLQGECLFSSLEFGVFSGNLAGQCGSGWPCSYVQSISWDNATTPRSFMRPANIFQRLFVDENATATSIENMVRQKSSILDQVLRQAQSLRTKIGVEDKEKLDQYLTSVEEVEQRLHNYLWLQCDTPDIEFLPDYLSLLDQMTDMMVIAMQCNYTPVLSCMTHAGGASHGANYSWVNGPNGSQLTDTYHSYSHHGEDENKKAAVSAINRWEMEVFASLLAKMEATPEGDGTLLDNSLIHFGKEYGNGSSHSADNMPIILVAGSNCGLQTGRYLEAEAPYANLLITEMQMMGVSIESFGLDGDGPLSLS